MEEFLYQKQTFISFFPLIGNLKSVKTMWEKIRPDSKVMEISGRQAASQNLCKIDIYDAHLVSLSLSHKRKIGHS